MVPGAEAQAGIYAQTGGLELPLQPGVMLAHGMIAPLCVKPVVLPLIITELGVQAKLEIGAGMEVQLQAGGQPNAVMPHHAVHAQVCEAGIVELLIAVSTSIVI